MHWPVPLPWPPVSVPIPKAVSSVVPVTVGLPVHVTAFVYRPIYLCLGLGLKLCLSLYLLIGMSS